MQKYDEKKHALRKICLIGFGEAGGIFGAELAHRCAVSAFDIVIRDIAMRPSLTNKAVAANVTLEESLEAALKDADLIISAVTATSAEEVARECATYLSPGRYFLDINSVSPRVKQLNCSRIEVSGAHYVEAAVMAPVPPRRLRVPILLGGREAQRLDVALRELGFNTQVASKDIGVASAIKMCRSIMIKGLEALTVECLFAARRYGAEEAVLTSLHASFPSLDWNGQFPDYLVSRVAEHGQRRAAEMREVAETLRDVCIEPTMANATAKRQEELVVAMSAAGLKYSEMTPFSWRALADQMQK